MSVFQKATRKQLRLRMTLDGPAGSGKTFTALRFAHAIAAKMGKRIAVINTESGAIEKYLGLAPDGIPFDFDIVTLEDFAPSIYSQYILAAGGEGYGVIVIDSMSHAWEGKGGSLDQVDKSKAKNSFTAWKDVTPQHRDMIEAILRSPAHVITTMRTKTEYVLEVNERGQSVPRRVGMKPVQREGMEYEFDVVCDLDHLHVLTVTKSRCPDIDGQIVMKPGAPFVAPLIRWLAEGSEVSADYFAVTEADLDKMRARDRQVAAQQPQKPVDFRAQLTAGNSGGASSPPGTVTAPPPAGEVAGSGEPLASEGQVMHIRDLFEQCEIPIEDAKGIIAKRGVTSIKDLTYSQAETLIDGLLARHKQIVQERREAQDDADVAAANAASKNKEAVPW